MLRRLAGDDPQVNEEWNCDKGRWAFTYATADDRLRTPLVRDPDDGSLIPASWPEALATAARGLADATSAGVLVGGRATVEDAYAYAKFARVALGTNDVDFRARAHSAEETQFLGARVAGRGGVTYADLETAPTVLLAGFEPEEESPIVFLRLRKAVRKRGLRVRSIAPYASRGLTKLSGGLLPAVPGGEAAALDALHRDEALAQPGAVILAGERLAGSPGALSAVARLAAATGARLAWIPRRAGERGAIEAGALGTLLPGGRAVADLVARAEVARAWRVDDLPAEPGRDTAAILAAAGPSTALLVGGVDPADLPDPDAALDALHRAGFVVSLDLRRSDVTDRADVVFPVAPVAEKAGTFLNWEGRPRPFAEALRDTGALSDLRVLDMLARELGLRFGFGDTPGARAELDALGIRPADLPDPDVPADPPPTPGPGEAVLASWRMMLDAGRMQDGEPHLAGTAHAALTRLSPATAEEIGATDGGPVTVSTERGEITLPLAVTEMPDRVVWVPMATPGAAVYPHLAATVGSLVRVTPGGVRVTPGGVRVTPGGVRIGGRGPA